MERPREHERRVSERGRRPFSHRPGGGRRTRGFTVLELMIVVVILGLLASLAVMALIKFVRRSQTSEVLEQLAYLFRSSTRYVLDSNEAVGRPITAGGIGAQFPATQAMTPPGRCCLTADGRCDPAWAFWETPTWRALDFAMPDPHRYNYEYESSGVLSDSIFTARGLGDLDCDNVLSTYERCGFITEDINVQGQPGVFRLRPIE